MKINIPIDSVSAEQVILIDASRWSLKDLKVERMEKKNMGMENEEFGPQ